MPNHLVAALAYDNLCTFEFGISAEIFGLPRPEMGDGWYRFIACSERNPLRALGGISVQTEHGLEQLLNAETIIIPGWRADNPTPSGPLRDILIEAHRRSIRLVTLCSGVFLLAVIGLLDGRKATTHWRYFDRLRADFPTIEVVPDVLYVDNGDILTAAGSAAGIDLLLHIVRKDFGADAANSVARRLVMPPHRDGGQAQYIERPVPTQPNGKLAPLLDTIRLEPARNWTVPLMAEQAAMSERTFIRRFRELTGLPPGEWLLSIRVDAARVALESNQSTVERVAEGAGFRSAATLRHHFKRQIGIAPTAYRQRFHRG